MQIVILDKTNAKKKSARNNRKNKSKRNQMAPNLKNQFNERMMTERLSWRNSD